MEPLDVLRRTAGNNPVDGQLGGKAQDLQVY